MGLFGRYNEEEFLDPDEIRLRRESAARSKAAHRNCVADHKDDYSGARAPANNTRPHTDCKADHRPDNPNTNVMVGVVIAVAILMIIAGVIIPIIT
ncbi:MAG: hypothetical protein MJ093_05120 [Saccharofermentans sp.]|nr:hypothetical protein [Saccharofermentans sp.]